jgi:copper chaperone CopZ
MQQAKMKIEGMHCGSCAIDIKETLEERAAFVTRRLITTAKPRSSNLTKI